MKGSSLFAASVVAAASATAVSASSSSSSSSLTSIFQDDQQQIRPTPAAEKFAPRFDGLRFIETLVTAHR
ncbi:hypothetical protein LINPERPRIM_LOCUS3397 [Linum perenne]